MPLNQQVYFCDENYNSYADFILRFGSFKNATQKKLQKKLILILKIYLKKMLAKNILSTIQIFMTIKPNLK